MVEVVVVVGVVVVVFVVVGVIAVVEVVVRVVVTIVVPRASRRRAAHHRCLQPVGLGRERSDRKAGEPKIQG